MPWTKIAGKLARRAVYDVAQEITKDAQDRVSEANADISPLRVAGKTALFGRLGKEGVRAINFNNPVGKNLKANQHYTKLADGISTDELTPETIRSLTNKISALYSNDKFRAADREGSKTTAVDTDAKIVIYDSEHLMSIGNAYGPDAVIGQLANQVGYQLMENMGLTANDIAPYEKAACADYIAGLTARLYDLEPMSFTGFYAGQPRITPNKVIPGRSVRKEAFERGYSRIDRGAETAALRSSETFTANDVGKTYQDLDLLKNILFEDIVEPLRQGSLVKM